ncbi:hypothetical protein LXL04_032121 [Taraxacum kok-saghyz]
MDESRYLPNYGGNQGYIDEDDHELEEDEEQQEGDAVDTHINEDDDDTDEEDEDPTTNDSFRHPKKRKLKKLLSTFQFSPRVPPPPSSQPTLTASTSKSSSGGRNTLTDWTEHQTFILLEAWGERFLQRGRKSLRSEEWQEVAEKVSHESKSERTNAQCRNRLDTLKKKYKKEKPLVTTKWIYFKKMDMLMSATPQQGGLSCGVDSGEFVFMNPSDSPGISDSQEGDDDSGVLPLSKRVKIKGSGGLFKLLADSINKFSEVYEKIEDGKRKQMVELENMKMDFYKELEVQKREILDRARDEIVKIRQGDYEENDISG